MDLPKYKLKEFMCDTLGLNHFATTDDITAQKLESTLSDKFATLASKSSVDTLSTKVNGDVNTAGSLLYNIKNNATITAALKGAKGDTGDTGPKGDTGATGPAGTNGTTPVRGTDY